MAREIKSGCKALVCAALVAMAVLALREPAEVAPDNKETGMRLVGSEVADAVTSGQVRRLVFTEADMNGYLRSTVRPKPGSGMIPGVEFQRAFVQFQPGVCWFGVQQAAFGFPIYTRVAYKPVFQNGKLVPELQGGSLGRLAVPKILMQFGDFMFENLWKGLKRDESSLRKMTAVVLEKQRVMFVTAGGNPVGTQ